MYSYVRDGGDVGAGCQGDDEGEGDPHDARHYGQPHRHRYINLYIRRVS